MDESAKKRVELHVEQWKHNRQCAKSLEARYRDWQINVIFYTALHLVDAALASLGVNATSHSERNDQVQHNESFAAIRKKYMNLYRISRITRYDADPDGWLPAEYLTVNDLVNDLLQPIENSLGPLVSKTVKFEPLPLKT